MYLISSLLKCFILLLALVKVLNIFIQFQTSETTRPHKYHKMNAKFLNPNETRILSSKPPFVIFFWTKTWHNVEPSQFFRSLRGCGNEFIISSNRVYYDRADVIVFAYFELNSGLRDRTLKMPSHWSPNVPWLLATQESAIRTKPLQTKIYDGSFNLTWGYRSNADIRSNFQDMFEKYSKQDGKWIYGSEFSYQFLRNKTKLAAWVVSNCCSESSQRQEFAAELARHGVPITVYGKCGKPYPGIETDGNWRDSDSFAELGKHYKFYMAFENSLCLDYITEKADHGWEHGMIPIIYALGNKKLIAPPNSYIDAFEFKTVEDLVKYIKFLDKNPKEYFKFFEWRSVYNISSSFHERAHCSAFEKIRERTKELRKTNDLSVRNKYVGRDLELWRSYVYNRKLNMYCKSCLTRSQVNITHLLQNKLNIYGRKNCLRQERIM